MILFLVRRRLTSFLSFLLQVSVVKCMSVQCYSLIQVEIKLRDRRFGAFWCLSLLCSFSPEISSGNLHSLMVPRFVAWSCLPLEQTRKGYMPSGALLSLSFVKWLQGLWLGKGMWKKETWAMPPQCSLQ